MAMLFIDLNGFELDAEEREMLAHPNTAGVILFSRNYAERAQLCALVKSIRQASARPLLITVDHEGGRVQRFRQGFSPIPAMGELSAQAKQLGIAPTTWAQNMGCLMASELRACDIDLSFAPVLDLDRGSNVIGTRAFSSEASEVISLAGAFIEGMHGVGMKATGKHFPGHGSVVADTHVAHAIDTRPFDEIAKLDMLPFAKLIQVGLLDAIMPAHVVYQQADSQGAGFSEFWLKKILRQQLGFKGQIFSDDLSMHGANAQGDYLSRANAALHAGCDLLLACNNREASISLLDGLNQQTQRPAEHLFAKAYPHDWKALQARNDYRELQKQLDKLGMYA